MIWVLTETQIFEAELSFDFRHFFHLSIYQIGEEVSIEEAYNLIRELYKETISHYAAVQNEWDQPASMTDVNTANMVELLQEVAKNVLLPHLKKGTKLPETKPYWKPFKVITPESLNKTFKGEPIPFEEAIILYAKFMPPQEEE